MPIILHLIGLYCSSLILLFLYLLLGIYCGKFGFKKSQSLCTLTRLGELPVWRLYYPIYHWFILYIYIIFLVGRFLTLILFKNICMILFGVLLFWQFGGVRFLCHERNRAVARYRKKSDEYYLITSFTRYFRLAIPATFSCLLMLLVLLFISEGTREFPGVSAWLDPFLISDPLWLVHLPTVLWELSSVVPFGMDIYITPCFGRWKLS